MRGRRRRDDGWDDGRGDLGEGGSAAAPGTPDEDYWSAGTGSRRVNGGQAGYSSGGAYESGAYPQAGYAATGYQGQGQQTQAYPANGYGTSGYAANGYGDRRSARNGYPDASYPDTGYADTGYSGTAQQAADYGASGYGGAAYGTGQRGGYQDQGSSAYGYPSASYADPRYAGQASEGYAQTGYNEPAPATGGYRDPRYDTPAATSAGYADAGYADTGYGGNAGYGGSAQTTAGYADAGYGGSRQSGTGNGDGGYGGTSATAQYGRLASREPATAVGEFSSSSALAPANEAVPTTPRPYGRLSIFTLLDDKAAEFDRLAEQAAEGVRTAEPDTLVYVIHVVPKAPMQRIIYEIYRDRAAFESHERQPHIQRFAADRKACVLATNIIDLRLKYAKVAALAGTAEPAPVGQTQLPSAVSAAPALEAPTWTPFANGGTGQYTGEATSGRYPELAASRSAGTSGSQASGSDARSARSGSQDWDQPSYQGQRYGGR